MVGGWEAGSQTVKPGSRPRALFTVAIPAQFHCLCSAYPFLGEAVNAAAAAAHQTPNNQVAAFFFPKETLADKKKDSTEIADKVSYDSAFIKQSASRQITCSLVISTSTAQQIQKKHFHCLNSR